MIVAGDGKRRKEHGRSSALGICRVGPIRAFILRMVLGSHAVTVLIPVDTGTGDIVRGPGGELVTYRFGDTDWPAKMLRNTSFIIHPEEVMADNFAMLMEWRSTGVLQATNPSGFPGTTWMC